MKLFKIITLENFSISQEKLNKYFKKYNTISCKILEYKQLPFEQYFAMVLK